MKKYIAIVFILSLFSFNINANDNFIYKIIPSQSANSSITDKYSKYLFSTFFIQKKKHLKR
jgi:hypothetical protein